MQVSDGAAKMVPLVHAQLVYLQDANGQPTGSLYIVGGVQKPLDNTVDF